MHPELFRLPFTHLTVKSYGLMLVVGFLAAIYVIKRLSRNLRPDPQIVSNCALYALIAGLIGARLFYVIHYFDKFKDNLLSAFAIWQGGLELLGGFILAMVTIVWYLKRHKLPVRHYLDIIAIALLVTLGFGKIGCFAKGCCFGKPTNLPWAVTFPYGSDPYNAQITPDLKRNRPQPRLQLPQDFFGYYYSEGKIYHGLKPYDALTDEQKAQVTTGPYRCIPVHPTQLYSSINAFVLSIILYVFWQRSQKAELTKTANGLFLKPGSTFALMFVLYSIERFFTEFLRDDNPFEYAWWMIYKGGTISQNLAIYMVLFGVVLLIVLQKTKPEPLSAAS
jgi:phosphatidylglycerol:prolipoprotein diacylglycerol transferase